MFDGGRLRALMANRGISQSELGRRVGISQASVYRLVKGEAYGTKHLHKIARELGTTPAYLSGETNDPNCDAPPEPALEHVERNLLSDLRNMPKRHQMALVQIANSLAHPASVLDLLPDEDALAEMFEALLMTMNRKKPLDEQARLLAQRLPIALSQLQDLLPPQPIADQDEAAVVPAPPKREAVSS